MHISHRIVAFTSAVIGFVCGSAFAQLETEYVYDSRNRLVTVTRDITPLFFQISDTPINEGGTASLTVSLSGPPPHTVDVFYATSDDTASAGSDYTAQSGTLTFNAGETSKSISIATINDIFYEGTQKFNVNLSGATGGTSIGDAVGVVTITDDEVLPVFQINNATASEGNNGTLTVTMAPASSVQHRVTYSTANDTATAGSDYTSKSGTLTFAAGQTSKTIIISTTENTTHEPQERLRVNLSSPTNGASIGDGTGFLTINDDDPLPTFRVNNSNTSEGNNGTLTITLSAASSQTHRVSYATQNNTATAGADYSTRSGTLTFNPGQTSKNVTIPTIEDSMFENHERVRLNLSSPTGGATIQDGVGYLTINNDDQGPRFAINDPSIKWESQSITFTITKTGNTALSHSVNYATANGSAVSGSDYSSRSGTLTFSAGQTSKTVTIPTVGDYTTEGNENFYVNLSSATGGAGFADTQGRATIRNNRPPVAQNRSISVQRWDFAALPSSATSDPDGHSITHSGNTQPSNATVAPQNGLLLIEAWGTTGTSTFNYTIRDQFGLTDTATVTVTVTGSSGGGSGGGPDIPY